MFRLNPDIRNTTLYYAKLFTVGLPMAALTVTAAVLAFVYLPWYSWAIGVSFCLVSVLVVWHTIAPFLHYLYCRRMYYASQARIVSQSGCSVYQGALGAGKSSLGAYSLVTVAQKLWVQLITDYFTMATHVPEWTAANDTVKLERWEEVQTAFEYYASHPDRVPCLFSTIPIFVGGRRTSELTIEHLTQKQRLPAYTAVFIDELSYFVDKWLFQDRNEDTDALAVLFRFFRHFFGNGCRLIATEQDSGNALKDLRRVMVSNEYILSQETILAPPRLSRRLERKRRKLVRWALKPRKNKRITPQQVAAYEKLSAKVRSIGFRRYRYVSIGNTEHDFGSHEVVTVYTPAALNCYYYDRTFERLYKCRATGSITANAFTTDTVDPNTQRLQPKPKEEKHATHRQRKVFL